jgi:hypothetical protein
MKDDREAGKPRKEATGRKGGKSQGGGKGSGARKVRVQFHLGETLIERLGVHASLVHRNQSAVVEEVMTRYLGRHGRGKELFPPVTPDPEGRADSSVQEGSARDEGELSPSE